MIVAINEFFQGQIPGQLIKRSLHDFAIKNRPDIFLDVSYISLLVGVRSDQISFRQRDEFHSLRGIIEIVFLVLLSCRFLSTRCKQ